MRTDFDSTKTHRFKFRCACRVSGNISGREFHVFVSYQGGEQGIEYYVEEDVKNWILDRFDERMVVSSDDTKAIGFCRSGNNPDSSLYILPDFTAASAEGISQVIFDGVDRLLERKKARLMGITLHEPSNYWVTCTKRGSQVLNLLGIRHET